MSQLRGSAPLDIELAEVKFTEHVAVCSVASTDKFDAKIREKTGLQIYYCGAFILFERPGEVPKAVSFSLVKEMAALADMVDVDGLRAQAAEMKRMQALALELEEKEKKLKAQAELAAKKAADMAAKAAKFGSATEVEAVELVEEEPTEENTSPTPPPIEASALLSDMRQERGTMADEEKRSMEAAVARANRGRKK
jgi:ADP-ribose pyrophosphatase YjhB (NUDIX family)